MYVKIMKKIRYRKIRHQDLDNSRIFNFWTDYKAKIHCNSIVRIAKKRPLRWEKIWYFRHDICQLFRSMVCWSYAQTNRKWPRKSKLCSVDLEMDPCKLFALTFLVPFQDFKKVEIEKMPKVSAKRNGASCQWPNLNFRFLSFFKFSLTFSILYLLISGLKPLLPKWFLLPKYIYSTKKIDVIKKTCVTLMFFLRFKISRGKSPNSNFTLWIL